MSKKSDIELAAILAAKQLAADVDELGDVDHKLAPFRLAIKREEDLRKAIRGYFDDAPAAQPFEAVGSRFTAALGPRGWASVIDRAALIKGVGIALYKKISGITLEAVKTHAPQAMASCVSTAQTGPRSLKVFECANASTPKGDAGAAE